MLMAKTILVYRFRMPQTGPSVTGAQEDRLAAAYVRRGENETGCSARWLRARQPELYESVTQRTAGAGDVARAIRKRQLMQPGH